MRKLLFILSLVGSTDLLASDAANLQLPIEAASCHRQNPTGATGPTGSLGPTGPSGPIGPTGPTPVKAYGSYLFHNRIGAPQIVSPAGFVSFDDTQFSPSFNTSLDPGDNTTVLISVPGVYLVSYGVAPNGFDNVGTFNYTFALNLNGTVLTTTTLEPLRSTDITNRYLSSLSTIITVPTGPVSATLQIENTSAVSVELFTVSAITAFLTIEKIGNLPPL